MSTERQTIRAFAIPATVPARVASPVDVRATVDAVRTALPALILYASLRAIGVLVLWLLAAHQHRSLLGILGGYDAYHYATIVERGYDHVIAVRPDGSLATTNLAFLPLLPGLAKVLDPFVPGGAAAACIAVSWLAGLAAAWGLYAIGVQLRDRRTGIFLAALWAVLPHALVESMGYTETLFTALCAWSLIALLRRNWLTAAVLCVLAGLTRPTGIALIAVVGSAALVAVVRRTGGWRAWIAALVSPLGLLGFVAWVGLRLGRVDGYLYVQNAAWRMSYDTGRYTVGTALQLLMKPTALALYVTTLVMLIALALLALLVLERVPWPVLVFAVLIVALAFFGDGYYHAKARFLLPAFPLLLPVASGLAGARRATAVVVLSVLAVISAGYGAYLALVWGYSP